MLTNKADAIENYILKLLASENSGGQVVLKRTDLADEVSCAPSQVSYVLSTRFTTSRGFKVESQRGLGGYIRITILDDRRKEENYIYQTFLEAMGDEETTFDTVKVCLEFMVEHKAITLHEAELAGQVAYLIFTMEENGEISSEERTKILTVMFTTLYQFYLE